MLQVGGKFDFGRYNHKKRDEAAEASALIACTTYIIQLLHADKTGKVAIPAFRHAFQTLLAAEKATGCTVNPSSHDDKSFVNFVTQQTVVIFYHLRRIKSQPSKRRQCLEKFPEAASQINKLMSAMADTDEKICTPQAKKANKRTLARHSSNSSGISLDEDGFPKMLTRKTRHDASDPPSPGNTNKSRVA